MSSAFYTKASTSKASDEAKGCWHARPLCHGGVLRNFR